MYDAHCHLSTEVKELVKVDTQIECNLMSTNQFDLEYVYELGKQEMINPCFGVHPWYSHLFTLQENAAKEEHYQDVIKKVDDEFIQVLPVPIYLFDYLDKVEQYLLQSSGQAMIGEIGLDKMFKLPWSGFYGSYHLSKEIVERDGKKLSNYQVSMKHQQDILIEFLKIAVKHKRPVSLHCVRSHGGLLDIVQQLFKDSDINIALHSYSGSIDHAKSWLKKFQHKVYFSISKIFNMDRTDYGSLIEMVPLQNLLLETDMGLDRYKDDSSHIADLNTVLESISRIKNKNISEVTSTIEDNWYRFKNNM